MDDVENSWQDLNRENKRVSLRASQQLSLDLAGLFVFTSFYAGWLADVKVQEERPRRR